jgi:hypothetical protein
MSPKPCLSPVLRMHTLITPLLRPSLLIAAWMPRDSIPINCFYKYKVTSPIPTSPLSTSATTHLSYLVSLFHSIKYTATQQERMNRSLNLLRPVGARGIASASSKIRPTLLARSPVSVAGSGSASRLSPRLAQSLGLSLRGYASSTGKTGQEGVKAGSSGSAEVPKENPHADQQNATSSAAEEVRWSLLYH